MTEQQKFNLAREIKNSIEKKYKGITDIPTIQEIQTLIDTAVSTKTDTTYVDAKIAETVSLLKGGVDADHDTLKELADAIVAQANSSSIDEAQVNNLIAAYMVEHPDIDIDEGQVNNLIAAYMVEHPDVDIDEAQVNNLIDQYLTDNPLTRDYNYTIIPRDINNGLTTDEVQALIDSKITGVAPIFNPVQIVYLPTQDVKPLVSGDYNKVSNINGLTQFDSEDYFSSSFAIDANIVVYRDSDSIDKLFVVDTTNNTIIQKLSIYPNAGDGYTSIGSGETYDLGAEYILDINITQDASRIQILCGKPYGNSSSFKPLVFFLNRLDDGTYELDKYINSEHELYSTQTYFVLHTNSMNDTLLVRSSNGDYADFLSIMKLDELGNWSTTYSFYNGDGVFVETIENETVQLYPSRTFIAPDGRHIFSISGDGEITGLYILKTPLNNGVPDFNGNATIKYNLTGLDQIPTYQGNGVGRFGCNIISSDESVLYLQGNDNYWYEFLKQNDTNEYAYYKSMSVLDSKYILELSMDAKTLVLGKNDGFKVYEYTEPPVYDLASNTENWTVSGKDGYITRSNGNLTILDANPGDNLPIFGNLELDTTINSTQRYRLSYTIDLENSNFGSGTQPRIEFGSSVIDAGDRVVTDISSTTASVSIEGETSKMEVALIRMNNASKLIFTEIKVEILS